MVSKVEPESKDQKVAGKEEGKSFAFSSPVIFTRKSRLFEVVMSLLIGGLIVLGWTLGIFLPVRVDLLFAAIAASVLVTTEIVLLGYRGSREVTYAFLVLSSPFGWALGTLFKEAILDGESSIHLPSMIMGMLVLR